jgi:hypothetical protein
MRTPAGSTGTDAFRILLVILIFGLGAGGISAQDSPNSELESLRKEIDELRRRDAAREAELARLKSQVEALLQAVGPAAAGGGPVSPVGPPAQAPPGPESDQAALDAALQAPAGTAVSAAPGVPVAPSPEPITDASRRAGFLNLINLSLDGMIAGGGSTATDDELASLEGGGHDPKHRGFTFQQAEISLMGAVDPYFAAEAHIVFTSGGVELEEAFATTQALPAGLQVKAGYFLSEFGRVNPTHPHAWNWLDQPVIATRLFGPDGMRSAGLRAGWLAPLPWYSELQVTLQNAGGETMTSFLASPSAAGGHAHGKSAGFLNPVPDLVLHEEEGGEGATGIGGRPLLEREVASLGDLAWLLRWKNAWDFSPAVSAQWGLSGMTGPNATGPDGRTWLYGTDLVVKWRPPANRRGWPFLTWESELMARQYRASAYFDDDDPDNVIDLPEATLKDWGFYSQILYGFRYLWAAGVRLEHASGSGESVGGRENDSYRDNRFRFSPLLVWQPSEFSRLRFQYNYDRAGHLAAQDAHSFWLGLEFLIGAHPVHQY